MPPESTVQGGEQVSTFVSGAGEGPASSRTIGAREGRAALAFASGGSGRDGRLSVAGGGPPPGRADRAGGRGRRGWTGGGGGEGGGGVEDRAGEDRAGGWRGVADLAPSVAGRAGRRGPPRRAIPADANAAATPAASVATRRGRAGFRIAPCS